MSVLDDTNAGRADNATLKGRQHGLTLSLLSYHLGLLGLPSLGEWIEGVEVHMSKLSDGTVVEVLEGDGFLYVVREGERTESSLEKSPFGTQETV